MEETVRIRHPLLIDILSRNRARLNSLYAYTRRTRIDLNGEAFTGMLVRLLEPLAAALADKEADKLESMVLVLYDKILELAARGFIGNRGKYPFFEDNLVTLVLAFPLLILEHPGDGIAWFVNALINITAALGERVRKWVGTIVLLAGATRGSDPGWIRKLGLIIAWRLGLAPYREKALDYCAEIDPGIFSKLFTDGRIPAPGEQTILLEKMRANPWYTPSPGQATHEPVVITAGGFAGFDGPFTAPPGVFQADGKITAFDGDNCYHVYADAYGCGLTRTDPEQAVNAMEKSPLHFTLSPQGKFKFGNTGYTIDARYRVPVSYSVILGNTICFASPVSYRIFIVGIAPRGGQDG